MSTKSDTTNAPIKRLTLSRETVKNLGVRSAVKTGILLPGRDRRLLTRRGRNARRDLPFGERAVHKSLRVKPNLARERRGFMERSRGLSSA